MISDDSAAPFLLMRAFRSLVDAVHQHLADHGFSGVRTTHGFALQAIGTGCTSVDLASRLGVTKQAATKTAQSLESLGLIERRQNEHDRRERIITVSPRGHRLLEISADRFRHEIGQWRAAAGDDAVTITLATLTFIGADGRPDTDLSDWE
ncbi:MarR family transcriptional regulator [Gordonia sp. PDNC005]|uniref:MarR family winged helix-turn-helix transcriptional regulator n=1 Tax=unclassified Gordonia (in: high G+C Gram-positive bacteria) TaxID=2657482 RepID=UPI0019631574|nr:MarR family transcriptional regulator [Gordonia sp. PDNC005]QRY63224.1 MarR family transcriptional regulator [Gordonia sp. PDNC005]